MSLDNNPFGNEIANNQNANNATIRFSFYDHRLSISKDVLYAIGKPAHIQIFITTNNKTLYIKNCSESERSRFVVPKRVYTEGTFRYVLQKAAFAEAVCKRLDWDNKSAYRMYGVNIAKDVMAFQFGEAEKLSKGDEDES